MTHDEAIKFMQSERKPALRWKPMDVAYGDNIRKPRRLVLEVNPEYPNHCYTTCSESDGVGSQSDYSLRSKEEWLAWVDRFSDDLTGRELREAKEAVCADFVEPQSWTDFRKRYAETGDPWIRETNTTNTSLVDTLMRPSNGSAMFWCRWPGRRSYRAAQREARSRRNRQLHHGRRS